MTIEAQRKKDSVFLHYSKDEVVISIALTMFEARNLRDFLTDMVLYEGDPTVIEAEIRRDISVGVAPLPKDFEFIALADSQRRNKKADDAIRDFYIGDKK